MWTRNHQKSTRVLRRLTVILALLALLSGCSGQKSDVGPKAKSTPVGSLITPTPAAPTHPFEVKITNSPPYPVTLKLEGPVSAEATIAPQKTMLHSFALPPGEYNLMIQSEGCHNFQLDVTIPESNGIATALSPLKSYWKQKKEAEKLARAEKDRLKIPPVAYKIIEQEDFNIKALGGRNLSDFSRKEVEELPFARRVSCRVVVTPKIKREEVQPTVEAIIEQVTSSDGDIDAITLFLYSDRTLIDGKWEIAHAVWGPNGEWAGIGARVAGTNDRRSHSIALEIRPDLEEHLADLGKSKGGRSEKERIAIYSAVGSAELRAMNKADAIYPITAGVDRTRIRLNSEKMDEILENYKRQIRQKYKASEAEMEAISIEGLEKGWPLDSTGDIVFKDETSEPVPEGLQELEDAMDAFSR